MPLKAGDRLGPYEITGFVGAGGMGEVYRARDPRLNRDVAIKILHASVAADSERLRRFTAEAQAVAALNHPNVLTIYEVGTPDGQPFIATELLEGATCERPWRMAGLLHRLMDQFWRRPAEARVR